MTEQQLTLPDGRTVTLRVRSPEAYTPNPRNTNRGKGERGKAALDDSLRSSGLHRGIVVSSDDTVINGNHSYESASELGVAKAWVEIEVEGDIGVVTKRIDWESAQDPKAIMAAIEDNRSSELNYELDPDLFEESMKAIDLAGLEIPKTLFTAKEIDQIVGKLDGFFEEQDEEEEEPPSKPKEHDQTIVPIVLTWAENQQWKEAKDRMGINIDKKAFLAIVEYYLNEGESYAGMD
jgi:hypothetical protein